MAAARQWDGLISRARSNHGEKEPWAHLSRTSWASPSANAGRLPSSWQPHPIGTATMTLYDPSHELRACRRSKHACASIERDESGGARLHVNAGGLVRVNDIWITVESGSRELRAGDVLELVCLQHDTVRQSSGLYAASCSERRGGHSVAELWRYVPERLAPFLSPSEDAKSFFPRAESGDVVVDVESSDHSDAPASDTWPEAPCSDALSSCESSSDDEPSPSLPGRYPAASETDSDDEPSHSLPERHVAHEHAAHEHAAHEHAAHEHAAHEADGEVDGEDDLAPRPKRRKQRPQHYGVSDAGPISYNVVTLRLQPEGRFRAVAFDLGSAAGNVHAVTMRLQSQASFRRFAGSAQTLRKAP